MLYALMIRTSAWLAAMVLYYFLQYRQAPNIFNVCVFVVIVIVGAMTLDKFLHKHTLHLKTDEARKRSQREQLIHMMSYGISCAITVGTVVVMWVWFPERLFEIKHPMR